MIRAEAYAKVNFGLRIGRLRPDGFHQVDGVFQSVGITDSLSLQGSDADSIVGENERPVIDGLDNLAFRAAHMVRESAESEQPLSMSLDKSIPAAAGLGGGSADAAAGLALAGRYFNVDDEVLHALAPRLGSDVPFCLRGGTARVHGRGEIVTPIGPLTGFTLAIVVPPLEISTPQAFAVWDEMEEPAGLRMAQSALPPQLRDEGDLFNDLYPAAVSLLPELDDWRSDLESRWGRPVMLSGSGPSLYGFFLDTDEAEEAASAVPTGSRFAAACDLIPVGWRITEA